MMFNALSAKPASFLGLRSKQVHAVSTIACTLALLTAPTAAWAADKPLVSPLAQTEAKPPATGDTSTTAAGATGNQAQLEELSLDDIQDIGIILRQINEQAKNIYEEASRTAVTPADKAELRTIHSIPYTVTGTVLPARAQWLVFFLGSVEPVVRELAKNVTDIKAGSAQLVIPAGMETEMKPLWQTWTDKTTDMNHQLDVLLGLMDDAPNNNEKIRAVAVAIYDDSVKLETGRKQLFDIIKATQKTGQEKIRVSPNLK